MPINANGFKMLKSVFIIFFLILMCGCKMDENGLEEMPINPASCTQGIGCEILSMGDETDDALLRAIHNETSLFFGINTLFGFFLEEENANAFTTKQNYIFFGKKLFEKMKTDDPANYATLVSGAIAHEYGYVMQDAIALNTAGLAPIRQRVNIESSLILSELEADAFSGFYMYFQLHDTSPIAEYFDFLESIGDTKYTAANRHGTPQQRLAAAAIGITTMQNLIKEDLLNQVDWSTIRYAFIYDIKTAILQSDEALMNERHSRHFTTLNAKERKKITAIARGEIIPTSLNHTYAK